MSYRYHASLDPECPKVSDFDMEELRKAFVSAIACMKVANGGGVFINHDTARRVLNRYFDLIEQALKTGAVK